MAEFLDTQGVSYYLKKLINNSNDKDINAFNNYITGIARTDKQLIKVFEFIEKIENEYFANEIIKT